MKTFFQQQKPYFNSEPLISHISDIGAIGVTVGWIYVWMKKKNTSELRVTNTKWLSGEVSMSSWKQQEDDPPSPNRLCLQLVRVRRHEEQGYKTRRISLRWETPHHKSMPYLFFSCPSVHSWWNSQHWSWRNAWLHTALIIPSSYQDNCRLF